MAATRLRIFISSVQKEFAQQRLNLKAFLLGDAVLRRFVAEVFLFEELPASDRRADQVYLDEVKRCDIYLGIFGYEYGFEDQDGVSPTEHEFDHATRHDKPRLVYVWGTDDKKRAPKMQALVRKASDELIRRRVDDMSALTAEVYSSMVEYLDRLGALRVPPFDTSACEGAGLKDLSRKRIDWFLETARRERGFPLKPNTTTQALLTHLNLLDNGKPTNAAVVLFGTNPQRFHRTAETKCVYCHGTEYRRPFASHRSRFIPAISSNRRIRLAISCWEKSTAPLAHALPASPHQPPTNCRPMPWARPSSTPSPTAITTAMLRLKSACSPTGWKSGTPAQCPAR